jgi:hypothetical protein
MWDLGHIWARIEGIISINAVLTGLRPDISANFP